jgi:hypothetical protein
VIETVKGRETECVARESEGRKEKMVAQVEEGVKEIRVFVGGETIQ